MRFKIFRSIISGRPVPNNYPEETISFEEPKRGDEGLLLFPFHSNPAPTNISWDIKGEGFLSSNGSSGRFTAEGWDTYVCNCYSLKYLYKFL